MRPFIVVVLAVLVLAGTKWFVDFNAAASTGHQQGELQLIQATGEYSVEVTLTFDVGPDEFALDVSDSPSLLVLLNGRELLRMTDPIAAVESPIVVDAVEGVIVGNNEFFVQASPRYLDDLKPRSVRVRIKQDGIAISDASLWPEVGDVVQGTLSIKATR